MPFPTVDGRTFADLFADFINRLSLDSDSRAIMRRLFEQVEVVSTQLYIDVQRLKQLANEHGWDIEEDDPSQEPVVDS